MKITKKYFLSSVLILFFVLIQVINVLSVSSVSAGNFLEKQEGFTGDNPIGKTFGEGTSDPTDIREIVVNVIKVFLTLVGIIALIMILLAGYKWMTSQGNQDKVGEAKSQLINAIIGLAIILASYMITDFVADCILEITENSNWMCGGWHV